MSTNIWQGKKVRLRAIEPEDWPIFSAWNLDTETARLCYSIPFPSSQERDRRWAADQAAKEAQNDAFDFAIENLQRDLVGVINTHTCNPRNGTFGYGLAVRREHWRKGYASEAILLVLRYFFLELRYQKVNVGVYAYNEASIRLHERLGFTQEGRLRRMTYTNGRYFDDILFGMTVEEFSENHPEYLPVEPK
jgi:RimJ/RimL family protein N-acetyltransferase